MEYGLYKILRSDIKIPYFFRIFFGVFCIAFAMVPIILPIFPGSFVVGIFIMITGILLVIQPRKIRHTIKLRKSVTYLFKNLHNKIVVKRKIRDIRKHVLDILKD